MAQTGKQQSPNAAHNAANRAVGGAAKDFNVANDRTKPIVAAQKAHERTVRANVRGSGGSGGGITGTPDVLCPPKGA